MIQVSLTAEKAPMVENLIFPSRGWSALTRDFQIMLRALGYDPGEVDGIYGPLTEAAYRRYLAACGGE
jgi:peptidoglycan hydrolase-like protein with peptidoglycan-binding domain